MLVIPTVAPISWQNNDSSNDVGIDNLFCFIDVWNFILDRIMLRYLKRVRRTVVSHILKLNLKFTKIILFRVTVVFELNLFEH